MEDSFIGINWDMGSEVTLVVIYALGDLMMTKK